jgi:hypothetical protein
MRLSKALSREEKNTRAVVRVLTAVAMPASQSSSAVAAARQ